LFLKYLYAGYAGKDSLSRVDFTPDETRPLPVANGQWFFIPFQGKSEIKDLRMEFECHNLATEVVVVRSAKLLDVISRKEKESGANPSRNAAPAAASSKTSSGNKSSGGETITDMTTLDKMKEEFLQTTHFLEETKKRQKSSGGDS